jgi:SPP1 family predicted phage head-tail adaptor
MRAGQLRHTVQLQTASEAADAYGEQDQTWSTSSTVHRCRVEPINGSERLVVYQVTPDVSHVVTMRYGSGVVNKNRLYINGARVFEIVAILDTEVHGREQKIACKELV